MSELVINEFEGYVSTGNGRPETVEMIFKDGPHAVHAAIVDHLGGAELLRKNIKMFCDKNYEDFIRGFHKMVERDVIARSLGSVIQGHFMNMGILK